MRGRMEPLSCAPQIAYVSCGGSHSAAVTTTGQLWVWGCGDNGRLGIRGLTATEPITEPVLVKEFVDRRIRFSKVRSLHDVTVCCRVAAVVTRCPLWLRCLVALLTHWP